MRILAAVLLLLPLAVHAAPVLVSRPVQIATDGGPIQRMTGGDFNRDGHRDFLLVQLDTVSVYPGRGDGTFGRPAITPFPYFGHNLNVGDYSGDGILDLATAGSRETDLVLFRGVGDGTFVNAGTWFAQRRSGPSAFGDFTGDGHVDLLTHGAESTALSLWPGDGHGGFVSPPVLSFFPDQFRNGGAIETADFDRDGKLDAVVSGNGATVIARGHADGTFSVFARVPGDHGVAVADFDSDGRPDLATTDFETFRHTFYLTMNRPGGTWQELPAGLQPEAIAAADMNGDAVPDLVLYSSYTGEVAIHLSRNDGTFAPPRAFLAGHATDIDVADYDGDGAKDVLAGTVLVRGRGDGTLHAPPSYPTRIRGAEDDRFPDRYGLRLGDVTGDGRPDVLTLAEPGSSGKIELSVLPGLGADRFGPPVLTPTGITSTDVTFVSADFDGDGRLDAVLSDPQRSFLSFYSAAAGGAFRPAVESPRRDHGQLLAGDFTGDGHLDVAISTSFATFVYPWTGSGFGPFQTYPTQGPRAFVADLDGDGRDEIISAPPGSPEYSFMVGVADADHDRHQDVVEQLASSNLRIHPGNGDGTLGTPYEIAFDGVPFVQELLAADVDGDEVEDLLLAPHLFLGNGDVHLLHIPVDTGKDVADLDGNGTLDFAVETFGGSVVILLTNVTEGRDIPAAFSVVPSHQSPRYGEEVTYWVRMAADSPYEVGGVVRLEDNGRLLGYATIGTSGLAELRTAFTQGPHTITATLLRNHLYAGATAPPVQHEVAKGRVALRASGTDNPSSIQQSFFIDVSLLVDGHSVLAQPTGTVRVFMDGTLIHTVEARTPGLRVTGSAPVGRHVIVVEYSGDENFDPATASYVQVVTPPPATISLTVTPDQPVVEPGTPLTLTASLGSSAATGTVTFFANDRALLTVPVENGTASLTISWLRSGVYGLRAHYSGDGSFGPAVSQPVPIEIGDGLPLRERRRSVRGGR